jgi:hypothetical protein
MAPFGLKRTILKPTARPVYSLPARDASLLLCDQLPTSRRLPSRLALSPLGWRALLLACRLATMQRVGASEALQRGPL